MSSASADLAQQQTSTNDDLESLLRALLNAPGMAQSHDASAPGRRCRQQQARSVPGAAAAVPNAPSAPSLGADEDLEQLRTLGASLQRQTALLEERERLVCRSLPPLKISKDIAAQEDDATNLAATAPALMFSAVNGGTSSTSSAHIAAPGAAATTAPRSSGGWAAASPSAAPVRALVAANTALAKELAAAQQQAAFRAAGDAARLRAIEAESEALRAELRVALASIAAPSTMALLPLPSLRRLVRNRSSGAGGRGQQQKQQDHRERERTSAALSLRDEAARIRQQVREAAAAVKRAHRQARERLDAMVAAQAAQVAELQQRTARQQQAAVASPVAAASPAVTVDNSASAAPAPAATATAPESTAVAALGSMKKESSTTADPAADSPASWTIPAIGAGSATIALYSSGAARSQALVSPRSKHGVAALRCVGPARGGQLERAAVARRLLRKELRETQDSLREAMEQRQAALAHLEQLAASIRTRLPSSAGRLHAPPAPPAVAAPGAAQQEENTAAPPPAVHGEGVLLAASQPATPQTIAAPPPPPLRSTLGSTLQSVGSPLSPHQPAAAEQQSGGRSGNGRCGSSGAAAAREVAAVRKVVELQRAQLIELAERYGRLKLRHARLKGRVAGAATAASTGIRPSATGKVPFAADWVTNPAFAAAGRRQGAADRAAAEWAAAATAAEGSLGQSEWQTGAGVRPLLPWSLGGHVAATEIHWRDREEEEKEMIRAQDEMVRSRLRPLVVSAAASVRGGASDGGASEQFYSCGGTSEGGGSAASGGGSASVSEGGFAPPVTVAAAEC